jgi:hypothetical protein
MDNLKLNAFISHVNENPGNGDIKCLCLEMNITCC